LTSFITKGRIIWQGSAEGSARFCQIDRRPSWKEEAFSCCNTADLLIIIRSFGDSSRIIRDKSLNMKKISLPFIMAIAFALTTCASPTAMSPTPQSLSNLAATIVAGTMQALPSHTPESTAQPTGEAIVVAFVREGDVHLWNSRTQQSELVVAARDATTASLSSDGQLIAFLRRWVDANQCEQSALWVVERTGENAREILSPVELREALEAVKCQSPPVAVDKIEWFPASHRLVYSLISEHEHSSPQGLYVAEADGLETTTLVPADHSLRYVLSPDGQQVALLATSGLSFINADGSNWRQDVVTYPRVGTPLPGFANGVWSLDSQAFLLAAQGNNGLNITRVPVDGSAAELLTTIPDTNRDSVTFSPDGEHVAFADGAHQSAGIFDIPWTILPLGAGSLAIPARTEFGTPANLHWSPANVPHVHVQGNLYPYCPTATTDYDVCNSVTPGYAAFYVIQWLDGDRFLFLTRDPFVLYLGRLDHTTQPVVAWPLEEWVTPQSFSAVLITP
jgi:dipeptidyl aminopeptidase/acylaminoacyl peptidase